MPLSDHTIIFKNDKKAQTRDSACKIHTYHQSQCANDMNIYIIISTKQ